MPFADGVYGRSAGQAYARAKAAKPAENADDSKHGSEDHEKGPQTGSVIHVKHHGGGKFSVKHEDGSVTKHESPEDLHEHMAEHFGYDQHEGSEGEGGEDYDSEYEGEGGDALKSILG